MRNDVTLCYVEMREIEAFLAVADELHFGRAADRLHVTTASVSLSVQALERRIGAPLFNRTSRRVSLTPLGERVRDGLRRGYLQLRDSLQEAQRLARQSETDVLRVGFAVNLPKDLSERMIGTFRRQTPGCEIARLDLPPTELFRWIEHDRFEVDVFMVWTPDPEILPRPVPGWVEIGAVAGRCARGAVMNRRHPLAGRTEVDIEELADHEVLQFGGYGPFIDGWIPPTTPAGRPTRRLPKRLFYVEDTASAVRCNEVIHLTPMVAAFQWSPYDFAVVPVTGLPPLACVTVWERSNQSPWIPAFNQAVTCS